MHEEEHVRMSEEERLRKLAAIFQLWQKPHDGEQEPEAQKVKEGAVTENDPLGR